MSNELDKKSIRSLAELGIVTLTALDFILCRQTGEGYAEVLERWAKAMNAEPGIESGESEACMAAWFLEMWAKTIRTWES